MTTNFRDRLVEMLSQGDLKTVLGQLKAYLESQSSPKKDHHRWMGILEDRYSEILKSKHLGILTQDQYQLEVNKIIALLLKLIDEVWRDSISSSKQGSKSRPKRTPNRGESKSSKKPSLLEVIVEKIKQLPYSPWLKHDAGSLPNEMPVDDEGDVDTIIFGKSDESEEIEMAPSIEVREPEHVAPSPPPPPAPSPPSPTQAGGMASPFQKGKILYAIPDQMALAEITRCVVRISPDQISNDELQSGLSDEQKSAAKNEGIKITQVMKVELAEANDSDDFSITTRNSIEQPILPFGFTEWAFDVTAKRPGHFALLLRVSAKIIVPGFGERSYDVAILDRAIVVSTTGEVSQGVTFVEQTIPDPNWDEEDEQAVLHALQLGRIDKAIERIANFVQDKDSEFHTELILLHARWNDNANQFAKKLVTTADWDVTNNQVRYNIVELMKELKLAFPADGTENKEMDWAGEKERIGAG